MSALEVKMLQLSTIQITLIISISPYNNNNMSDFLVFKNLTCRLVIVMRKKYTSMLGETFTERRCASAKMAVEILYDYMRLPHVPHRLERARGKIQSHIGNPPRAV